MNPYKSIDEDSRSVTSNSVLIKNGCRDRKDRILEIHNISSCSFGTIHWMYVIKSGSMYGSVAFVTSVFARNVISSVSFRSEYETIYKELL